MTTIIAWKRCAVERRRRKGLPEQIASDATLETGDIEEPTPSVQLTFHQLI
jgi:hypothetical protein